MVEFALVTLPLVILLFGTIQVGLTFAAYNAVINGVREGARYASVCTGPTCGSLTVAHVTSLFQGGVVAHDQGSEGVHVTYSTYQDAANLYNVQVTVVGCVTGVVFIPLVGDILGWKDPGGVVLSSTESFRVEGDPTTSTPTLPAAASGGPACS